MKMEHGSSSLWGVRQKHTITPFIVYIHFLLTLWIAWHFMLVILKPNNESKIRLRSKQDQKS